MPTGAPAEHEQLPCLPPGRSPAQLEQIMDTLARLTPISITPIGAAAARFRRGSALGRDAAAGQRDQARGTRAALLRLRERGRNVAWLYLGDDQPPQVPGVVLRHAPSSGDWRA